MSSIENAGAGPGDQWHRSSAAPAGGTIRRRSRGLKQGRRVSQTRKVELLVVLSARGNHGRPLPPRRDWRKGTRSPAASSAAPFRPAAGSAPPAAAPAGGYSGRKLTCRQIGSYARAQELLRQGHTYLDRHGDGVACESLR